MNRHPNILICGYVREIQSICRMTIPLHIIFEIDIYYPKYLAYGIGDNEYSQFGIKQKGVKSFIPLNDLQTLISSPENIFFNHHSFSIITSQNELYVAGNNSYGKLGLRITKSKANIHTFTQLKIGEDIQYVSSGTECAGLTFIQTISNNIFVSGSNQHFQAGHTERNEVFLKQLDTNFTNNDPIKMIYSGSFHTLFLTKQGILFSCGSNYFGRCGQPKELLNVKVPTLVKIPDNRSIVSISCASSRNLLIDEYGCLIVFGSNYGQYGGNCGMDVNIEYFYAATVNTYFNNNNIRLVKAECGHRHSICLDENGVCYTFGQKDSALGIGEHVTPEIVNRLKGLLARDISAQGARHCLLITIDGKIIAFGYNLFNQCSSIVNKRYFYEPFVVSKEKELNLDENKYVEKVIAMPAESIIIINNSKNEKSS